MDNDIVKVVSDQKAVVITLRNGVTIMVVSNPDSAFVSVAGIEGRIEVDPARAANYITLNYTPRKR